MEGQLKIWINILQGWKTRYFILHDDILTYCEQKGGAKLGSIHLKVSSIILIPDDPLRIIINSGTNELNMRALTITDKINWVNVLKSSQDKAFKDSQQIDIDQVIENDQKLNAQFKQYLQQSSMKKVGDYLAEIWSTKAQLDEVLSIIKPKISNQTTLYDDLEKIDMLGTQLKKQVTLSVQNLQDEKTRLYSLCKILQQSFKNNDQIDKDNFINLEENNQLQHYNKHSYNTINGNNKNNNGYYENYAMNDTQFLSFHGGEESTYYRFNQNNNDQVFNFQEAYNAQENQDFSADKRPSFTMNQIAGLSNQSNDLQTLIKIFQTECPVKYRLLTANKIFTNTVIPTEYVRVNLPAKRDPNESLNIWSLLKNAIGKDLTKFAVPVFINEPISMLQRLAEQIEYVELLDLANTQENSCFRMAYVVGFAMSICSTTIGRTKKPFNPILGETFEYIDEKKNCKFISEQVSHHPPISAGYCENENYKFWQNSNVKTTFWGKSLEIKPQGPSHVVLLKNNDHIVFYKCKSSVNNIIIGKIYVDHIGDFTFKNHTTQDTAVLTLKQRGWGDKGAFECSGQIKDSNNVVKYTMVGRWDSHLDVTDVSTNQTIRVWTRNQLPADADWEYYMTTFSKQLNYLNIENLKLIPASDCRLRPDQRALEHGDIEYAAQEKNRLEEKQRARRKELQSKGEVHKPIWFEEKVDPKTKEKEYYYLGGYFEERNNGFKNKEIPDLF